MRKIRFFWALPFVLVPAACAQTPAVLDHFACYLTPSQPQLPQIAWLQDQFDVRNNNSVDTIYDIQMLLFCNPTKKTVISATAPPPTVPIAHPTAHLAMYKITEQQAMIPRSVPITNQFGAQTLITGEAEMLAVPSGKSPIPLNGGPVSLPPVPDPGVLDHFLCYSASGPAINRTVLLNDQFFVEAPEAATVLTPRFFCNPVRKTVLPGSCPAGQFCATQTTPISHPSSHMACYLMSVKTPFQGIVAYNNQFVLPGTLPTAKLTSPVLLCVPSAKSEAWTPIPAPGILTP